MSRLGHGTWVMLLGHTDHATGPRGSLLLGHWGYCAGWLETDKWVACVGCAGYAARLPTWLGPMCGFFAGRAPILLHAGRTPNLLDLSVHGLGVCMCGTFTGHGLGAQPAV